LLSSQFQQLPGCTPNRCSSTRNVHFASFNTPHGFGQQNRKRTHSAPQIMPPKRPVPVLETTSMWSQRGSVAGQGQLISKRQGSRLSWIVATPTRIMQASFCKKQKAQLVYREGRTQTKRPFYSLSLHFSTFLAPKTFLKSSSRLSKQETGSICFKSQLIDSTVCN
jgi:hypothetical protein